MNTANRGGRPPRGFTLVELLTVIAIIAILIALVVGAVTGVKASVARENTRMILNTLDGALKRYYSDWGAYPYYKQVTVKVTTSALPGATAVDTVIMDTVDPNLIPPDPSEAVKATGLLYLALSARVRNGPYMPGAGAQTVERKITSGGKTYSVLFFADGWGRPLLYGPPLDVASTVDNSKPTTPRLESKGADEFDESDNIKNYNYDDSLEKLPMYQTN